MTESTWKPVSQLDMCWDSEGRDCLKVPVVLYKETREALNDLLETIRNIKAYTPAQTEKILLRAIAVSAVLEK
tara:strand:+ start:2128 stop:2346 length:219 start_codon:yes stop_codon:yes gene_type:complete